MKKFFKRIASIALCLVLAFCLPSCEKRVASNYDYYDAYTEGYYDGISEAQDSISFYVDDRFNEISYENKKERGIYIEDAIAILTLYADGEPITEEELHNAIWSVEKFYYDAWDIVWDIDDYSID